jgi:hypothetical protein
MTIADAAVRGSCPAQFVDAQRERKAGIMSGKLIGSL